MSILSSSEHTLCWTLLARPYCDIKSKNCDDKQQPSIKDSTRIRTRRQHTRVSLVAYLFSSDSSDWDSIIKSQ